MVYFEERPGRQSAANLLSKDEARCQSGTTVRTKLRLRNRFPNGAMEIFGRRGKMRVG
jgi:hypothetical protein